MVVILETYEAFEEKWIEQDAMIRNFEIIGEASTHISKELQNNHPYLPWNEMRGMRNFMAHEYFGLQLDTICNTAVDDIPVLHTQIQKIIMKLKP